MLALEFDRAERLLEKVLVRVERLSDRAQSASRRSKILAGVAAGAVVAAAIAAVFVWGIPFVPDESYR
jgi:diacylglycerol kinase